VAVEREALGRELEQFDLDVPRIEIDGERSDQVLRCETKAGPPTHPITVQWSMFESSVVYSSPQWGTQRVPLGVECRDHRRRLDTAGREASQLGGSPFAPKRERGGLQDAGDSGLKALGNALASGGWAGDSDVSVIMSK